MKQLLTYLLFAVSFFISAQRITNLNVSLVTGQNAASPQVLIRFTLTKGQACPGYNILHSLDSINYLQIYSYPGICGNQTSDESHSYTHGSPAFNQTNYYRVEIPGYETSRTMQIYVTDQVPKSTMIPYPNPLVDQDVVHLKFLNLADKPLEGFIYNQFGVPVIPVNINVKQGLSQINISSLNDGLYIIWLTDGLVLMRNKIIVKRI